MSKFCYVVSFHGSDINRTVRCTVDSSSFQINRMSTNTYSAEEIVKILETRNAFDEDLYHEAVKIYTDIIDTWDARRSHESKSKLYTNRARVFTELNKNDEAIRDCHCATNLDPSNASAFILAAECYITQNKLKRAVRQLEEAAKQNTSLLDIKILMKRAGNALYKAGELQGAYDTYTKALNIPLESVDTDSELYGNRATVLFYLKRYTEALEDCDKAIEINPRYCKIYLKKADIYAEMKVFDEAIVNFNLAITTNPNNPGKNIFTGVSLQSSLFSVSTFLFLIITRCSSQST